jgi:predicted enzyme related to lactoylglutathione lyase
MPRVAHFEIMSEQPEKTIQFWTKVFGWKFTKWNGPMEYWLITTGDPSQPGIDGGLSRGKPVDRIVLSVSPVKLDSVLKAAVAAGGAVAQPKGPIPGVGWFAAIRGPDGNLFGVMEDDPTAK